MNQVPTSIYAKGVVPCNCNHRLARDTGVWQKSLNVFSENQELYVIYNEHSVSLLLFVNCLLHILCISNIYNIALSIYMYLYIVAPGVLVVKCLPAHRTMWVHG